MWLILQALQVPSINVAGEGANVLFLFFFTKMTKSFMSIWLGLLINGWFLYKLFYDIFQVILPIVSQYSSDLIGGDWCMKLLLCFQQMHMGYKWTNEEKYIWDILHFMQKHRKMLENVQGMDRDKR